MDTTPRSRTPIRASATALAAAGLLALTACGGSAGSEAQAPAPRPVDQPADAHPLTATDVDAWLDGYVPAALDREGIPGAAVAVVHDGEVVSARGFGWADRDDRVPVDPDATLFRTGSISKTVTATAVMQLVEDGEVDLDTDVATYVDVDLERPVTLRHLLTHTGGFEERVAGLIAGPDASVDLREAMTTDPPEQVYEPGTTPAYSNYGNSLAGLVVEEVSGEPFEDYVADHVLAPAGMTSSTFAQPLPGDLADRLAAGYAAPTGPASEFETVGTAPAGAMTASASDMARYMLAQLDDDGPLLEEATRDEMFAPALGEDELGGLARANRMTLGWFDRSRGGHRVVEHGGDTIVFHTDLALWPEDGSGIFVAMNGTGREATSTLELRQGLLEGFADRYHPGDEPAPADDLDPDRAAEQAEALAGSWEPSRTIRSNFLAAAYATGSTTITAEEDGRVLVSPGPNAAEPVLFEPVDDWTWREVGGSSTIAARVVDGEVEAVGYDSAFAFLPVPADRAAAVPVLGASLLVLVAAGLTGGVAAVVRWVRRRRGAEAPARTRTERVLRLLTGAGVASAVLATVGWVVVVTGVMGFAPPSTGVIRGVQLLQLLALLAVVPAAWRAVDAVRRRRGLLRVLGPIAVTLALVGLSWVAVSLRLLAPDITY